MTTTMLRRLRMQQLALGVVWSILAVARLLTGRDGGGAVVTTVVGVLAIGFFVFAVLLHLEVRRRVEERA